MEMEEEIGALFISKIMEVDRETGLILSSKSGNFGDIQRLCKTPKESVRISGTQNLSVLSEQKGKE